MQKLSKVHMQQLSEIVRETTQFIRYILRLPKSPRGPTFAGEATSLDRSNNALKNFNVVSMLFLLMSSRLNMVNEFLKNTPMLSLLMSSPLPLNLRYMISDLSENKRLELFNEANHILEDAKELESRIEKIGAPKRTLETFINSNDEIVGIANRMLELLHEMPESVLMFAEKDAVNCKKSLESIINDLKPLPPADFLFLDHDKKVPNALNDAVKYISADQVDFLNVIRGKNKHPDYSIELLTGDVLSFVDKLISTVNDVANEQIDSYLSMFKSNRSAKVKSCIKALIALYHGLESWGDRKASFHLGDDSQSSANADEAARIIKAKLTDAMVGCWEKKSQIKNSIGDGATWKALEQVIGLSRLNRSLKGGQ